MWELLQPWVMIGAFVVVGSFATTPITAFTVLVLAALERALDVFDRLTDDPGEGAALVVDRPGDRRSATPTTDSRRRPSRCSSCARELGDERGVGACRDCGRLVHAACWLESGRCPDRECGGPVRLARRESW